MMVVTMLGRMLQDGVDQTKLLGFLRAHELVTLHARLNKVQILVGMLDINLIELLFQLDDLLGMDLNVSGLAMSTSRGLVNHDPGIGKGVPHAWRVKVMMPFPRDDKFTCTW